METNPVTFYMTEIEEGVFGNLYTLFTKNLMQAKNSGALPDNTSEYELMRVVLMITAENQPLTPKGKKLLTSLKHFI